MEYETGILGLRKHKTYEEVLNYINEDPDRIKYPNRKDIFAYDSFAYGALLDALKDETAEAGPPGARPPEFAERRRPDGDGPSEEIDPETLPENPPDDVGDEVVDNEEYYSPQDEALEPPAENPADALAREEPGFLEQLRDRALDGARQGALNRTGELGQAAGAYAIDRVVAGVKGAGRAAANFWQGQPGARAGARGAVGRLAAAAGARGAWPARRPLRLERFVQPLPLPDRAPAAPQELLAIEDGAVAEEAAAAGVGMAEAAEAAEAGALALEAGAGGGALVEAGAAGGALAAAEAGGIAGAEGGALLGPLGSLAGAAGGALLAGGAMMVAGLAGPSIFRSQNRPRTQRDMARDMAAHADGIGPAPFMDARTLNGMNQGHRPLDQMPRAPRARRPMLALPPPPAPPAPPLAGGGGAAAALAPPPKAAPAAPPDNTTLTPISGVMTLPGFERIRAMAEAGASHAAPSPRRSTTKRRQDDEDHGRRPPQPKAPPGSGWKRRGDPLDSGKRSTRRKGEFAQVLVPQPDATGDAGAAVLTADGAVPGARAKSKAAPRPGASAKSKANPPLVRARAKSMAVPRPGASAKSKANPPLVRARAKSMVSPKYDKRDKRRKQKGAAD